MRKEISTSDFGEEYDDGVGARIAFVRAAADTQMIHGIFPLRRKRDILRGWFPRFLALFSAYFAALLLFGPTAAGQLAPINPPPSWGNVPMGTGACTIGRSCAELAPAMIQSALGPSPLEENLRHLMSLAAGQGKGPATAKRVADGAADAMRRAGADEVRVEKFGEPAAWENVVAQIRGRENPNEFVVLAAHIGSGGGAAGVCNAAMVIDAARVIEASGNIPRRSIRFVLFSGDGSRAYVRGSLADLDRTVASVSFDSCGAHVTGYSLGGRKDTLAAVREALGPIEPLGATQFTLDAKPNADTLDFLLEGVPTLTANHAAGGPVPGSGPTPDADAKIDIAELKRHVAIAAVTAYALADTAERIGPRQSRAEIEQLLKDTGLADRLKSEGTWPQWESGQRGRPQ